MRSRERVMLTKGGHAETRGDEDEWMGYEAEHGAEDEMKTGGRHEVVFDGSDGRGMEGRSDEVDDLVAG